MGVETFKLRGGACKAATPTAGAGVLAALMERGIGASISGGVVTVTRTDLDGVNALDNFEQLCRVARAAGCGLEYVVSV